ncbi:helix-turn-helix domain-containing protein [Kitasatospora camelliae]|uniref:Helix-turn-helix domain-containing protein n=1 Tax=Kitasatospora camelliae TaxID=3156397 RepID=A0AAU8K3G4_9ACTN
MSEDENELYSIGEVAERLGLHVRTVRTYVRDGRLKAVRIGKQYRIARRDFEALTGAEPARAEPVAVEPVRVVEAATAAGRAGRPPAEVSSVVVIDDVDRRAVDRLSTLVTAAGTARSARSGTPATPLSVQAVHDPARSRLRIVILGDAAATADLLLLIDAALAQENNVRAPAHDQR